MTIKRLWQGARARAGRRGVHSLDSYNVRSALETLITDYSHRQVPKISIDSLAQLAQLDRKRHLVATTNYLTMFNTRRLTSFRSLPYLAVLNPHISKTYNLYLQSLQILLQLDLAAEDDAHRRLVEFSNIHRDAIPSLSQGMQEISSILQRDHIIAFLNAHFRDKIYMDSICSNYIHSSVIKRLRVSELVRNAASFVNDMTFIKYYKQCPVKIDHGDDIDFPYIGNHLEYIFTEILKNSIRAHIETGKAEEPILVTMVLKKSDDNLNTLEIRFRDRGGGISPEVEKNIFDYSFSTVCKEEMNNGMGDNVMPGENVDNVAGMGYGLPLAKAYVEQFGGSLELQSYYGWGTDIYVKVISPDESLLD